MANNGILKELNTLRLKNNLSHEDMAKKLSISKTYYWQIENQKRRLTYEMALKIASIFKKKPDSLFYNDFQEK